MDMRPSQRQGHRAAMSGRRSAASLPEDPNAFGSLHSQGNSEVAEQPTDLFTQFFAVHDHVDQAVFLKKFSGLKSFRQLLMRGFLDHTRPGETDHASWLCNDNIAQGRKTGHHTGSSRVCKN